jgi:peptide/nickel transport system permease protein
MNRGRRVWLTIGSGAMLVGLLCGEFVAPYPPQIQHRSYPLAPPTPLLLVMNGPIPAIAYAPLHPDPDAKSGYRADAGGARRLRWWTAVESGSPGGPFHLRLRLFGPSSDAPVFLLGTDELGRDLWSRLLSSARYSIFAGVLATLLALGLGFAAGSVAGYRGGWVDAAIMRFTELLMTLPWFYLVLAASACFPPLTGSGETLLLLVLMLGLLGWAKPARLIRGAVLSAREQGYVQSALGFGAPAHYILRRHILPQVRDVLLAQASSLAPQFILAEVALTFLGVGAAPAGGSLGEMLAALQRLDAVTVGWWLWAPALVLILVCIVFAEVAESVLRTTNVREVQ